MKNKGLSLIEIIVVVAGAGLLGLLGSQMLKTWNAQSGKTTSKAQVEENGMLLLNQLIRTGRLAKACRKPVGLPVGTTSLECDVDMDTTGTYTPVRFTKAPNESVVRFQKQTGATWTTILSYGGGTSGYNVKSFLLCDDADMQGTPPSCTSSMKISPSKITDRYATLRTVDPSIANRFFRFSIELTSSDVKLQDDKVTLQSAFFIRSPLPYVDSRLQWGTR